MQKHSNIPKFPVVFIFIFFCSETKITGGAVPNRLYFPQAGKSVTETGIEKMKSPPE